MKFPINGGCGFLGSNLAAHALTQGIELCVFDSLQRHGSQSNLHWLRGQVEFAATLGKMTRLNGWQLRARAQEGVSRVLDRINEAVMAHTGFAT